MKLLIIFLVVVGVFCKEMAVTREQTEYLKKHVDWGVVDYEDNIFRGWTMDEFKETLLTEIPVLDEDLPYFEADKALPSVNSWDEKCIPEPGTKKNCGSSWAFAVVGMLSTRCCLSHTIEKGWLSVQELINCDTRNHGCKGGWPSWALRYIAANKGLVHSNCSSYNEGNTRCTRRCEDGKDWKHICNCYGPKQCVSVENMKGCLKKGPFTVTFAVDNQFTTYKSGIYTCKGSIIGLYSGLAIGHSDNPECHWTVRAAWGPKWGENGNIKIACQTCGIHGIYNNGNVMCEQVK